MFSGQSIFGIAASGIYFLCLLACVAAGFFAKGHRQSPSQTRSWLLVALMFAIFLVLRAFDLEEILRQEWRDAMRAGHTYEIRRELQRPLAAATVVFGSAAGFWIFYYIARRPQRAGEWAASLALLGAFAMTLLLVLRLISLHALDAVLYGPLKLNWIVDFGSSLVVLGVAIIYIWRVRQRA